VEKAEEAEVDTEFSTVGFTLSSRGDIQLSGASRAAVSPAGAHPVSADRAHRFARPDDKLLVVLRHWPERRTDRASRARAPRLPPPEEPSIETGFLVDTANWVRADLDGHPLQWVRRDTIRIDTTNAAAGDRIRLTLSAPHGGRYGQRPPPPEDRVCEGLDPLVDRRVVLPAVESGDPVVDALAGLRKQCLDIQYASLNGDRDGRPGTVQRILVPLAGQPIVTAAVPPFDGTAVPDRMAGDTVLTDPSRPATIVVAR
jgi:hypothetical protein